jgi:hypothetical protein
MKTSKIRQLKSSNKTEEQVLAEIRKTEKELLKPGLKPTRQAELESKLEFWTKVLNEE